MAGRLEGKVALVSGAARGQGRSHAVRLAQEGADIIAFDVCRQLGTVEYPMANSEDLKETVRLVEDLDRRIVAREADVRDRTAVQEVVDEGLREFVLVTGQSAALRDVGELLEDRVPDPEVGAMAERIGRRLAIRRRPRTDRPERGSGRLASVPYRYRSDDIDLDRTIEVLTERPLPEDTDIIVRERMRSRRAVVLVVDVSGSMRGEKVRIAAATVAALSAALSVDLSGNGDQLALVAFWSDPLLKPLGAHVPAARLLDQLLRIPARGLTNVQFALAVAHAELSRSSARRRTAVLLTDAVHNAGPDPRLLARRFPELHVLLETDGEHDAPLAADLARLGRGRLAPVATHRDVAPALNRLLA